MLNLTSRRTWQCAAVVMVVASPVSSLLGADVAEISVADSIPAPVISYDVDPDWPKEPSPMAWEAVPGVAFDGRDCIWVFTRTYEDPVRVYRTNGDFVRAWGTGAFVSPHHLRIDRHGNVWAADFKGHVVRKFSQDGALLLTLGTPGVPGDDAHRFNEPTDMAITADGSIFVSDGYKNSRVVHFNRSGTFVKDWGRLGNSPGEFHLPHAIAVDSRGLLYVADRSNSRIQIFDQRGCFCDEWKSLIVPWGIWITPTDDIWVCGASPMVNPHEVDAHDQILMRFDRTGRVHQLWAFPRDMMGNDQVRWIHGIAVDNDGNIYLGEIRGKCVKKYMRHEERP
jgi:streptogramin lyase